MPVSVSGRLLYRMIRGKRVAFVFKNKNVTPKGLRPGTNRLREITAWWGKKRAGVLNLSIPVKGKTATIMSVDVAPEFRKRGISSNLFKRTTDFLSRAGFKFLRSDDLQHPAQVKIRRAYGKYRIKTGAGIKTKNRTRFFADQFGPYGEETRRITSKEALEILKDNPKGRLIEATTMIKKWMGRKR